MTRSPVARAQRIGLGVILLLGSLDAWRYLNYQANPDGISYVDLAIAFTKEGPGALVNGYWSPLLPALIGLAYRLFEPTLETMYRTAHVVGFAVFIVATFSFNHLLSTVRRHVAAAFATADRSMVLIVALSWSVYALYILKGVGVQLITPDIGVAAITFRLAAATLSLGAEPWPTRRWIAAGALLAIGYWWKAIVLPVGLIWFFAAAWMALRRRDRARGPAAAAIVYGGLALVLIVPVSRMTGRVTFGETGRLNYLWYVNGAPYVWERCRPPGLTDAAAERFGSIARDTVVSVAPLTCMLSSSAPGTTMPLWDDPSRYYRDAHIRTDLERQLRATWNNLSYLRDGIFEFGPLTFAAFALAGVAAMVSLAARSRRERRAAIPPATRALVALVGAPIAFYLAVYVEFRHLAPFFVVAALFVPWMAVAAWKDRGRLVVGVLAVATVADLVTRVSEQTLIGVSLARAAITGRPPARVPFTQVVARGLRADGLEPGMRVASMFNAWNAEWAQLAGLRIRAHVPDYTTPLTGVLATLRNPCARSAWDDVLRAHRIDAAVARLPIGFRAPPEFRRVADTEFFIHHVPRTAGQTPACPAPPRTATRSSSETAAR